MYNKVNTINDAERKNLMAKYCPQCNLKHSNKAEKCVKCNGELEVIQADLKKKRFLIGFLIGILTVALIVGGILFFTGPKAKVRSIMQAFKRGDVDAVVDTFPDFIIASGDLDEQYLEYQLPNLVSNLSEYKFSYKITKVANPSFKEKENILAHISRLEEYGCDPLKLQDIKVVFFTMKGVSPGQWGSSFNKFILIKYDGTWYWWPFYYEN